MFKRLIEELGAFVPLEKPYELRTADKGGRLRIVGYCRVGVTFQGTEVPGGLSMGSAEFPSHALRILRGQGTGIRRGVQGFARLYKAEEPAST